MASVQEKRRNYGSAERSVDLFISSVDHMEVIGDGMLRMSFLVNIAGEAGHLESVVADFALVMPMVSLPDAIGKAIATTSRMIFARDDGTITLVQ